MRKAVRIIAKYIGLAGLFLLTANAKAVVAALGLDKLAANPSVLGAVVAAITSPAARAVALIAFGIGLWTAFDWLARKWDATHPSQDELLCAEWADLSDLSGQLGDHMEGGVVVPGMGTVSRVMAKLAKLQGLGLRVPAVPPYGPHPRYWMYVHKIWIDLLVAYLREGQAAQAREQSAAAIKAIEETTEEQRQNIEQQIAAGQQSGFLGR